MPQPLRLGPFALQTAATTGNGQVAHIGNQVRSLTFFVTGAGTITAGTVVLEEAPQQSPFQFPYTGTWSEIQTVALAGLSGGEVQAVHIEGSFADVRARISADVEGGGTVSVEVQGI